MVFPHLQLYYLSSPFHHGAWISLPYQLLDKTTHECRRGWSKESKTTKLSFPSYSEPGDGVKHSLCTSYLRCFTVWVQTFQPLPGAFISCLWDLLTLKTRNSSFGGREGSFKYRLNLLSSKFKKMLMKVISNLPFSLHLKMLILCIAQTLALTTMSWKLYTAYVRVRVLKKIIMICFKLLPHSQL